MAQPTGDLKIKSKFGRGSLRPRNGHPASLGKYKIVEPLASGGMARIYLARTRGEQGFEKTLVVKHVLPHLASSRKFVTMFLDEARLAARLDHQNIVQVYDFGHQGEDYYLAMEYLQGHDVRTLLHLAKQTGKRIPIKHAVNIVCGVAAALDYAHRQVDEDGFSLGIIHRDVAPSNIIVSGEGAVKLADFGIARAVINNDKTEAGQIKGKLSYLSPEQCKSSKIDSRSDIFSLGIVLFELTTMTRLFPSEGRGQLEVMQEVVAGKIPRPSRRVFPYPAKLERIVMRALHRDPAQRYQTAAALLSDLETFARDSRLSLSAMELGRFVSKVIDQTSKLVPAAHPSQSGGAGGGSESDGESESESESSVWRRLDIAVHVAPEPGGEEPANARSITIPDANPAGQAPEFLAPEPPSNGTLQVKAFYGQQRRRRVLLATAIATLALMFVVGASAYWYQPSQSRSPAMAAAGLSTQLGTLGAGTKNSSSEDRFQDSLEEAEAAPDAAEPDGQEERPGDRVDGEPDPQSEEAEPAGDTVDSAGTPERADRARRRRARGDNARRRARVRARKERRSGSTGRDLDPREVDNQAESWDKDDLFPPSRRP